MKSKCAELSRLYHAALKEYLRQGSGSGMEPAHEVGRHALSLGLETLDLARVHEIALASLVLPGYSSSTSDGLMGRAGMFFTEAITPIEQTHRGAREANAKLNQVNAELSRQTRELAASNQELQEEIVRRMAVEESLRASELTASELLAKSQQMQEELRHLSRELLTAQEEERRKISRELHDVIAQTLTSINVRLASLKAESKASIKELQSQITTTQRLVEKSVDIVHRFARELRPTVLDDLGLIPALRSFLNEFTENTGVRASLKAFAEVELLNNARRTVLYRVAQEALTNVARHAQASRADVVIENLDGIVRMRIKDDGKGFEVDGSSRAKKSTRLGLLGMRERVEMVGGTFSVDSAPGMHTIIRVDIPAGDSSAKKPPVRKIVKTPSLELI
jgi:signal transduction histidine kinase